MADDTLSFLPGRAISLDEAVYLNDEVLEDVRVAPWAYFEGSREVALLALFPTDADRVYLVGFAPDHGGWVRIGAWGRGEYVPGALKAAADEWLPRHYTDEKHDGLMIAGVAAFE